MGHTLLAANDDVRLDFILAAHGWGIVGLAVIAVAAVALVVLGLLGL